MPDPTRAVYEARAAEWVAKRRPSRLDEPRWLAARLERTDGRGGAASAVVDLGCGPGWHTAALGPGAIALDLATSMLDAAGQVAPGVPRVQADLRALPFRRHGLGAAFASKSYVHLDRREVPRSLADLHRSLAVDAPAFLHLLRGDMDHGSFADDTFPGRRFSLWPEELLRDVLVGAGFTIDRWDVQPGTAGTHDEGRHLVHLTRSRTLADTVGPGMGLLVCGLNPSVHAADAGVGFARPGNRFWPAALAAGIVSVDRAPIHALAHHSVGMTDLVKRATPRADELTPVEYRDGMARLERLAAWLQPRTVCFVGLVGWRAAVDRKATPGPQPHAIGGRPVYVMPSTSGVNTHASLADLTNHLRRAAALVDG